MRKSLWFVLFLVLIAGMLLTGCSRRLVNVAKPAEERSNPVVVEDSRVEKDRSLRSTVRILEIIEAPTSEGFLKVQVRVRNGRRSPRTFLHQWVWLDENGMEVRTSLANWRETRMQGHEEILVTGISPVRYASNFRFKMIEPRS